MTDAWIQTVSGKKFPLDDPDPSLIDIEDIAHALSLLVRFNGHGTRFYSVAEHSVHVSHEVAPDLALVGLLHDAAEAYLGDVPAPLKRALRDFQRFENRMEKAVAARFGLNAADFRCAELKRADVQLLVDEKARMMVAEPAPWPPNAPSSKAPSRIRCWVPARAKAAFLNRFNGLITEPCHQTQ